MTHALKTWPEFYKAVESGKKKFEVRVNDRPFKTGDILLLQEYDNDVKQYTGKELQKRITYILNGNTAFGVFSECVVMSLESLEPF